MASATVDQLTDLEAEERHGALVYMKRRAIVTGLAQTSYAALAEALSATGLPAANATYNNLICQTRHVAMIPGETTKAYVDLEYVERSQDQYNFVFSGSTALTGITTQVDRFNQPISLTYAYPAGYPYDSELAEATVTQGAETSVMVQNSELSAVGVLSTSTPYLTMYNWVGTLNATAWAGAPIGRYLVTRCEYAPHDVNASPRKYRFTFTFQGSSTPWQPRVTFIDPNTGRPPSDLVENVGKKTIYWYTYKDFNTLFPL